MKKKKSRIYGRSNKKAVKSGFEAKIIEQLTKSGKKFVYEGLTLGYISQNEYTPDLILENGIIIELKGFFRSESRTKMSLIKVQHPKSDIRIVFQRDSVVQGAQKRKDGSRMTCSEWAKKYGFIYAIGEIPESWFEGVDTEDKNSISYSSIEEYGGN